MTAPAKDFEEQFGEVLHHLVSCCTKTLWGLMCASLTKQTTFLHLHHYGILIVLHIIHLHFQLHYHSYNNFALKIEALTIVSGFSWWTNP